MQSPTRILIVEDEPLVAKTLCRKVTNLGYQVTGVVATGDAGVAALAETRPDLSLADIGLDGAMDGIEFGRIAGERGVPVVYVTGLADPETLSRAKVTDPYGYVTKPFDDHDLHVAIEIALYRHQMQRELERRNEMLRAAAKVQATASLAAGVGHHFNNLLQIMMGYAEVIREERGNTPQVEKAASTIVRVGRRARDVVRRMMVLSCAGETRPEVLNVGTLLNSLGETLRTLAPDNVQIAVDAYTGGRAVNASRADVENIVVNLATNAIEAMRSGGRLRVGARDVLRAGGAGGAQSFVVLSLSDTGPGLSKDVHARLFEPFFTTKDPAEGLGLGLVTALALAQRNGGLLEITSEPGAGATAHLSLPAVESIEEPSQLPVEHTFGYPVARRGETVLVVDDDPDVRGLLVHDLRLFGYTVLDAEDGPSALEVVRGWALGIHLLVTDIVMPTMSGTRLAAELTKLVPGLKVLFITGDRLPPPADGAWPYLAKPFSKASFAVQVRAALDDAGR